VGVAIGRIGCLLHGCDFGAVSDLPWAVTFPQGAPAWDRHVELGLIARSAPRSLPVHPSQLYESLTGLGLLGLTLAWRRVRRFPGEVLCGFFFAYGVIRAGLLEPLRADPQRGGIGPVSTSQLIGALSVTLAAAGYLVLLRRHRRGAGVGPVAEVSPQRKRRRRRR
jgi:phosphatidylglycerol:prolipoprotein diacylglycerol transferase